MYTALTYFIPWYIMFSYCVRCRTTCASLLLSASLWWLTWVRNEVNVCRKTKGKPPQKNAFLQLHYTMMRWCIYFQHWDLANQNLNPKGSGSKIVILLDFNKCYMDIFNKIDFLPSHSPFSIVNENGKTVLARLVFIPWNINVCFIWSFVFPI